MATLDKAGYEKALQENYLLSAMQDVYRLSSVLLMNLEEKTGKWTGDGRNVRFTVRVAPNPSGRAQGEKDLVAEAGKPRYEEMTVSMATMSAQYELTEMVIAASEGKHAYAKADTEDKLSTIERFGALLSQFLWGRGDGIVARVKSIAGSTVTVYDGKESGSNQTYGMQYLLDNQRVSFTTSKTLTTPDRAANATITSRDIDANTFVIDDATGVAAGDYVVVGSLARHSLNLAPTGLRAMVDQGSDTATYEGIDRTAAGNGYWKGNVKSSFAAGDIEAELRTQFQKCARRVNQKPQAVLFSEGMQNAFFNQLRPERQQFVNVQMGRAAGVEFQANYSAIMFHLGKESYPCIADSEHPPGKIWGLNWDTLKLGFLRRPQWATRGGGELKDIDETLMYRAIYYAMVQLLGLNPAANFLIEDGTEAA